MPSLFLNVFLSLQTIKIYVSFTKSNMKKIVFLFSCGFLLWGCGSEEVGINNLGNNVFEISSEYGLNVLRTSGEIPEGITVRLINDIVLSSAWTPIEKFHGILDGQGYTISNLRINSYKNTQGFIKNNEGFIRNLKVSGNISGGDYVGGICAFNSGKLENCTFSGSVTGDDYVGGICGRSDYEISDCLNFADVKGQSFIGGICGLSVPIWSSDSTFLTRCVNQGNIHAKFDYAGGIAGYAVDVSLKGCSNSGSITGKRYTGGISGVVGNGMLGSVWGHDRIESIIWNCSNSGQVQALDEESSCHGGICGYTDRSQIGFCHNTALITGGGSYTGGIVGYSNSRQIDNCRNSGRVSPLSDKAHTTGGICGGIFGALIFTSINEASFGGIILNSINEGEILTKGNTAGGIVGKSNSSIIGCYNIRAVTSTDGEKIGGICGEIEGSVIACYNNAPVNGQRMTGGIAGASFSSISGSYNLQNITGSKGKVGGICGHSEGYFSACYNTGKINGPTTSSGSICGNFKGYSYTLGLIKACYYIKGTAPAGIIYEHPYSWEGAVDEFANPGQASQAEVDAMNREFYSPDENYKYIHVPGGFPALEKISRSQ